MAKLTHFDDKGSPRMVDVTHKPTSQRRAVAEARIALSPATYGLVKDRQSLAFKKGDIFAIAETAGIMAAKQTASLIPLCHPLPLTHTQVTIALHKDGGGDTSAGHIHITADCRISGRTGVEMEALTAVTVAALTIYDMLKAVDKSLVIDGVRLMEKSGGKSGDYRAQ